MHVQKARCCGRIASSCFRYLWGRVACQCQQKNRNFENTKLHVDKNDIGVLQMVIIISYLAEEECFCILDARGNNCVLLYDREVTDSIKLHLYVGYFHNHFHGKVEVDEDWRDNCDDCAWILRIAPYTTAHWQAWNEKLVRSKNMVYTVATMRSLYMMPGSAYLGRDSEIGDVRMG
jgi:hypothetical protein